MTEYRRSLEEFEYLKRWLVRLTDDPGARQGFTAASIQAMILRIQREIAEYDAADESSRQKRENTLDAPNPTHGEGVDESD